MECGSKLGLGSCCDLDEYFLRIVVIVSTAERRKENGNHRGSQCVNKRRGSFGQALVGERGQAGDTAGERMSLGYFRAFTRRSGRVARRTEGEDA